MYKKGRVNSNSRIISTDEDPSLRIESSAIINLRGVSTKLNKYKIETVSNSNVAWIIWRSYYTETLNKHAGTSKTQKNKSKRRSMDDRCYPGRNES